MSDDDTPATRAARIWRHREQIEHEAAVVFAELGRELDAAGHAALATRARAAAADELRHAARCRALVACLGGSAMPAAAPPRRIVLGPAQLSRRDRLLYAAVAVGCVTESLSCALLLELRETATHPLVKQTVDEIVRDEIEHARLGWATLAAEAAGRDVTWLAAHVAAMGAAALAEDVTPLTADEDLASLGVLPRALVRPLVDQTWATVIAPGLRRHGIAAGVS